MLTVVVQQVTIIFRKLDAALRRLINPGADNYTTRAVSESFFSRSRATAREGTV